MIVAFQPGGTIQNARVVLRWQEKLPRKYNNPHAEVFMESFGNPRHWLLVKPAKEVLPEDSPLLSEPELAATNILDLTATAEPAEFDHVDIIRFDEED
jgi:hypothetical protein